MCLESRAISARVTKQIVTIFSKTCDNGEYCPELGYRRTRACERPSIYQRGTIFTNISAITLLLYSYKYLPLI